MKDVTLSAEVFVMADADRTSELNPQDPQGFRHALGHLAGGLTVLSGGDWTAMTVQSIMSLSMVPPLLAIGVREQSHAWQELRRGEFVVNILASDQGALARSLGRYQPGGHAGVETRASACGAKGLLHAHAWFGCRVVREHLEGDHLLVVAEVVTLEVSTAGEPLLYHKGLMRALAHPHVPEQASAPERAATHFPASNLARAGVAKA